MIIGVTGLIGSGKSEVAKVFQNLGMILIDADKIGKDVVEKNSALLYQLVLEFGGDIIDKNGKLIRKNLGLLAFSSKDNTEKLNRIVHPYLLAQLDKEMAAARRNKKNAVIDSALLIYWNYQTKMDRTILVVAKKTERMKRLKARGLTEKEIEQRSKSQLSEEFLKEQSDIIITNNIDKMSLKSKVRDLFHELVEKG